MSAKPTDSSSSKPSSSNVTASSSKFSTAHINSLFSSTARQATSSTSRPLTSNKSASQLPLSNSSSVSANSTLIGSSTSKTFASSHGGKQHHGAFNRNRLQAAKVAAPKPLNLPSLKRELSSSNTSAPWGAVTKETVVNKVEETDKDSAVHINAGLVGDIVTKPESDEKENDEDLGWKSTNKTRTDVVKRRSVEPGSKGTSQKSSMSDLLSSDAELTWAALAEDEEMDFDQLPDFEGGLASSQTSSKTHAPTADLRTIIESKLAAKKSQSTDSSFSLLSADSDTHLPSHEHPRTSGTAPTSTTHLLSHPKRQSAGDQFGSSLLSESQDIPDLPSQQVERDTFFRDGSGPRRFSDHERGEGFDPESMRGNRRRHDRHENVHTEEENRHRSEEGRHDSRSYTMEGRRPHTERENDRYRPRDRSAPYESRSSGTRQYDDHDNERRRKRSDYNERTFAQNERRRTRAPQDHDSRRRRSRTPSPSETNVYSQRPRYDRDDNRRHRKDSDDHRSYRRDEIDQKLREETAKIFQQALNERKKINEANQNRKIEQDVTDPSEKEVHILKRERESSPKRPIRDRRNSPSRVISKLPRSSQGPISDENPTDAQPQPPSEEINHPQVSSAKDQRSRAPPESSQLSTSNQLPKSKASETKVQPARRNESASPAAPRKRQPPLSSLEEVMSRVKQEMEKAKQQKQKEKPKEEEAKASVPPVASTISADQATLSSSVEPQGKVKPPVKELKPAPVPDTNPWKQKAETSRPPSEESAPSKKKRKESEVAETESPQPESSLEKKAALSSRQSARGRGRGRGRVTSTSSSAKGKRTENTKNLSNNDILYYQTQGFFIKKKEKSKADDDASETPAKESDDGSDQLPDLVKTFSKSSVTSSEENMKLKEPIHSGAVVVEGVELSPDQYEEGEFTEIKSRRKKKLEKQGSSEITADVNGKKSAKETKRKQADKNLKGPVPEKVSQSDNTLKKAQLSKDVSSSKQPQPISKPQLSKSSSQPSIVATSGHEQRAKSEPPTVPRVSIQSSSPLSSPQHKKLVDRAVARPESPTSQQQKSATSQIISKNPWGSPSVGFSSIISPTSPQSIPQSNVWKDIQDNSFKSLVDFSQINQAEDSEHEKEDHDDETLIAANKMVEGVLGETEDISKPVLNISPSSSPQTAASSIPPSTSNANQTFVRPIQPVPGFYGPQSVIAPVHGYIRPPGPHHQDQPQWQFVFAYPTHPQSSGQQLRMPTYSDTWMAPRPVPAPGMQFDPKLFSSSQPPAVPSFFDKPYTSVNPLYPSQVSSQSSSHSSQPAPIGQSNASQYRPGGKQYTPLLIDPSSFGMSMGLPVNINGMGVGIGMPMPMMSVNMNQMNQNAKPPSSVPATSDSVNVNHSSVNRMSVSSSPKPSSVSTSQPPSSSMSPPRRAAPGHHKFNARPQVSAKATKSPPKPTLTHNTPGSVPSVSPQPSASGAKTSTVSSTQRPVPSVHTGPPPRRQFIPPRGYQAGPPRGFRPHFNARPSYSPRPFFGAGRGRGAGPQRFNQRPSSSAKVGDKVNTTTQDDEGTKETQEENKESAEINAVQDGEGMNTVKSDAPTQNGSTIQDNADVAKEPTGTSSEKETAHELSSAEETKENEEPSKTDSGTEPTTESAAKPTSSKGVRNMSHRPIIARPKGHYYGPPSARGNYRGGFMPTRGRGGSAFNSSRGGFGAPRGGIGGARGGFAARGGQGRGGIASRGSRGRGGSS